LWGGACSHPAPVVFSPAAPGGAGAAPPPPPPAPRAVAPPAAPLDPTGQIDPAALLLFSVDLNELTLTDGLSAYGDANDPLLPVGELTRLLEMDVDVLPAERRIVGRIGEARRSLIVDLATNTVREGGRTLTLTPADVAVTPGEIYIRASALQKLLPLKIEVDPESLAMKLTGTEKLPVQGRLERMARKREGATKVESPDEVLKVVTPYKLFSMPAFDVGLGVGAESGPKVPWRYDIRTGGDLFYTGFQGYLGSDENGKPSSARVTFERRSVEGYLLGPLHARTISFGDVFTPTLPIGPRGAGGRGVAFSTVPLDETNIFNRVDLRGELPLGYDVELYVNDILRSGQNTPTKGRYEFLNVPLSQGINVVRIVTYGPRGERSEQTRIVNVGAGLLRRGEATFEFGAVQQDESVITLQGAADSPGQTVSLGGQGGMRAVAAFNYGVSAYLTLSAGAALIPIDRKNNYRELYTVGARTSLFGFATQFDVAQDRQGGTAAALGLAGQVFGVSTVLRHLEFINGFTDETGPDIDLTRSVRRRSEASFDGNIQLAGRVIPLSFRMLRSELSDGTQDYTGSARASTSAVGILFSAGMEYQRTIGQSLSTQQLSGFFAGSTFRSYKWQIRSTLDYDILPELKARALAITADRDLSPTASIRFGIGQSLEDFNSLNLTASSIFKLGFGDLALTGEYNNADQSWRALAQLNFGLTFNPDARRYQVTRPGPASGGSVLFEAFLDKNGNGIFDAGDEPVPGVTVEGGERKATTGPGGRAFITGVGAAATQRLVVGLDNVDNTQVIAPPSTVQFSPRGGSFTTVRYPMKPTGEMMVHLRLKREDGSVVGLSATQLQLVGDNGYTAEAATEFDGSAMFSSLPIGKYQLQIDPDQARRLRMHLTTSISVTVKGDGSFIPDAQAEVVFEPRPKETPDEGAALEKQTN
jgi:hypothetical protein